MHPFFQRPGVRRVRIVFRWCRIYLWLALFLVVAAVAYLHLVGLPDFLKQHMLRSLLAQGVEARFSNMQLGLGRRPSVIVEDAAFSRFQQPLSPHLSARRAELALSWEALLHFHIEVHSLQVADAQLQLPVSETNHDALSLDHVAVDMRFYSNDIVRLDVCQFLFRGIQVDVIGKVDHINALRDWRLPEGGGTNGSFQDHLREVAQTLQKIHFAGTPVLQIEVEADGRDMNSFRAELNFVAPAAHTPWGDATTLVVDAACARLIDPGKQPFLQVEWSAARMDTPWAQSRKISCFTAFSRGANSNLDAEIRFDATQFSASSNGFGAGFLSWNGSVTLASSNFTPLLGAGKLHATEAKTPWGSAHELSLECGAAPALDLPPTMADWGPWTRIAPWTLDWQVELHNMASPKLHLDQLAFSGHWHAPQLVIENLHSELYGGQVNADATLDVGSRELHCHGTTDFNPHSISPLLKPSARDWLAQLDWETAPKVNAHLRAVLPPWTNTPTNQVVNTNSSFQLAGDFTTGPASYRQVPARSAAAHVTFTNGVWNVSHLHAVRPEGVVDLDYTSSAQTQSYHLVIDSHIYPKAALPLLGIGHPRVLDELTFKQPPEIHANVWGSWSGSERLGLTATVLATNFIARGETVAAFVAGVEYTNLILTVHNLILSNTQCLVQAPWTQVDCGTKMVKLTNAIGTADPAILQRILGTNSPDWLNSVHFSTLPTVSANGFVSLTNALAVDMHFLVTGEHFRYGNLFADRATGGVDWTGPTVILTNIVANAYSNGTLMGWISFTSTPKQGSDFRADFTGRDIDLSSLATGITGKTNRLEGRLDGDITLYGPNSSERSHLQGAGRIHVHDGLLWDIKIFGVLSPVLNLFSRDWGHSRAREAQANFIVTNGTVSSDDLVMRCTGFRINLRGKVDRNKQINARIEATLSREAPIIGPLLSMAFTPLSKLFEYHLTGSLNDPVMEPVFVPRFITFLLHPFKAGKNPAQPESPPAPQETK